MSALTLNIMVVLLLFLVVVFALLLAILFISHTILIVFSLIRDRKQPRDRHGRFMHKN